MWTGKEYFIKAVLLLLKISSGGLEKYTIFPLQGICKVYYIFNIFTLVYILLVRIIVSC